MSSIGTSVSSEIFPNNYLDPEFCSSSYVFFLPFPDYLLSFSLSFNITSGEAAAPVSISQECFLKECSLRTSREDKVASQSLHWNHFCPTGGPERPLPPTLMFGIAMFHTVGATRHTSVGKNTSIQGSACHKNFTFYSDDHFYRRLPRPRTPFQALRKCFSCILQLAQNKHSISDKNLNF